MNNSVHIGMILTMLNPYTAKVWFPTFGGAVPIGGKWRAKYKNTCSDLDGSALENAEGSTKECFIATKLASGAWFKSLPHLGASVFNNHYKPGDKVYDYNIATDFVPSHSQAIRNLQYKADNPAQTMCPFSPLLNLSTGTPVPSHGNLPPGTYPQLEENQWVLVIFPDVNVRGIIIASVPSEEELKTMLGE